jgi:hypothetical protein
MWWAMITLSVIWFIAGLAQGSMFDLVIANVWLVGAILRSAIERIEYDNF